jgi:hypothetical protein
VWSKRDARAPIAAGPALWGVLDSKGTAGSKRRRGEVGTVADKVKGLISVLAPEAVCDPCIAERLGLGSEHQATHRSRELAGDGGFERRNGTCALCGETRAVTRKHPR